MKNVLFLLLISASAFAQEDKVKLDSILSKGDAGMNTIVLHPSEAGNRKWVEDLKKAMSLDTNSYPGTIYSHGTHACHGYYFSGDAKSPMPPKSITFNKYGIVIQGDSEPFEHWTMNLDTNMRIIEPVDGHNGRGGVDFISDSEYKIMQADTNIFILPGNDLLIGYLSDRLFNYTPNFWLKPNVTSTESYPDLQFKVWRYPMPYETWYDNDEGINFIVDGKPFFWLDFDELIMKYFLI